jgi:hypothetical protein
MKSCARLPASSFGVCTGGSLATLCWPGIVDVVGLVKEALNNPWMSATALPMVESLETLRFKTTLLGLLEDVWKAIENKTAGKEFATFLASEDGKVLGAECFLHNALVTCGSCSDTSDKG